MELGFMYLMFYLNLSMTGSGHIFFWPGHHAFLGGMTPPPSYRSFLKPHSAGGVDTTFLLKRWP